MFIYSNISDLRKVISDYHDDIIVSINRHAKGERGLIDAIALAIDSPYDNDNWDGLTEVLYDPFWLKDKIVRIVHFELPELSDDEMHTYLSILKYIDDKWSNKPSQRVGHHCLGLIIYFNAEEKTIVETIIDS